MRTSVLIVDDHDANARLVESLLMGESHVVSRATNGRDALDVARVRSLLSLSERGELAGDGAVFARADNVA